LGELKAGSTGSSPYISAQKPDAGVPAAMGEMKFHMSISTNEFEQLMERVRAGCPEAKCEVVERYGKHIQLIVRHRLSPRLRSQFDSLDFAQDAWASFFNVPVDRYFFKTPEELVNYLASIAHHKLVDVSRKRLQTVKHARHEEQPIRRQTDEDSGNEPPARQPTPSQLAIADEQRDLLQEGQPAHFRRALEMLHEGHTHQEVAQVLGVHPKMLQRMLQHLNRKLSKP
jgi:RNA polymerase sigma-70 factor (ECF subfamily)